MPHTVSHTQIHLPLTHFLNGNAECFRIFKKYFSAIEIGEISPSEVFRPPLYYSIKKSGGQDFSGNFLIQFPFSKIQQLKPCVEKISIEIKRLFQ